MLESAGAEPTGPVRPERSRETLMAADASADRQLMKRQHMLLSVFGAAVLMLGACSSSERSASSTTDATAAESSTTDPSSSDSSGDDAGQDSPEPLGEATASTSQQRLFAVTGDGVHTDGRLELTLAPNASVSWIADRPDRSAGSVPPPMFVDGWGIYGFASDPPNAFVVTTVGTYGIELTEPSWDPAGGRLTFTARGLDGETPPEGALGQSQLFVDDAQVETCGLPRQDTAAEQPLTIDYTPGTSDPTAPPCSEISNAVEQAWSANQETWQYYLETPTSYPGGTTDYQNFDFDMMGRSWACTAYPPTFSCGILGAGYAQPTFFLNFG